MKKFLLIILLMILIPGTLIFSEQSVADWWNLLSPNEKILIINNYVDIVNGTPKIIFPDYYAVIHDNSVFVIPEKKASVTLGILSYEVTLDKMEFKNIIPENQDNFYTYVFVGAVAFAAGLVVGILLPF